MSWSVAFVCGIDADTALFLLFAPAHHLTSHVHLVCDMPCRLGTIKDCTDKPEEAEKLLSTSYKHFDKQLGPKNPLTGEAQFALALSAVRQMVLKSQSVDGLDPYTKVLAPQKKQELLQQMQKGLQAMQAGFGADHMLVKKALSDYDLTATALRRV